MMDENFIHEDLFYAVSNREDGNLSCKWGLEETVIGCREKFLKKNGLAPGDCVIANLGQSDGVEVVGRNDLGKGIISCRDRGGNG